MDVRSIPERVRPPETGAVYWLRRLVPSVELTAFRIALAYLVLGLLALFGSDVLLVRFLSEPALSRAQALKGGVEVVLTTVFIFIITHRREAQLDQRRARLAQQREELQVLHRVLRHNLRNDVNVIRGNARWLSERLSTARLRSRCSRILEAAEQIEHYTEQASRIERITESNGDFRALDLTAVIPRLVETHPHVTDGVELSTTLPEDATVEANPMLADAIAELVTNGIVHNDAETPRLSISVTTGPTPRHMVDIRVEDNGRGIPDSELQPLRAGEEEALQHLSGMGLWFVEWTVRHSRGDLEFVATDSGGSAITIRVPKAPEMLSTSLKRLS